MGGLPDGTPYQLALGITCSHSKDIAAIGLQPLHLQQAISQSRHLPGGMRVGTVQRLGTHHRRRVEEEF